MSAPTVSAVLLSAIAPAPETPQTSPGGGEAVEGETLLNRPGLAAKVGK